LQSLYPAFEAGCDVLSISNDRKSNFIPKPCQIHWHKQQTNAFLNRHIDIHPDHPERRVGSYPNSTYLALRQWRSLKRAVSVSRCIATRIARYLKPSLNSAIAMSTIANRTFSELFVFVCSFAFYRATCSYICTPALTEWKRNPRNYLDDN